MPNKLKQKDLICRITTWLNIAFLVGATTRLLFLFLRLSRSERLISQAGEIITNAEKNDIGGGIQILGGLGLGAAGLLGIFARIVTVAVIFFVVALMFPGIISGSIAHSNFKKLFQDKFKTDSIIKIICDGIVAYICITSITTTQIWWITAALLPFAVVVLSIISLCIKCNTI